MVHRLCMRRRRTTGAVLLVCVLALAGLDAAGPRAARPAVDGPGAPARDPACLQRPTADAPVARLSGADRFETAACVAQAVYPGGASHVIVARGDADGGLADALAGAVLAHALEGPVLLSTPQRLPAPTRGEILRLGATRVTILGGVAAIGPGVEADLVALGLTVDRIGGATRHDTAAAISVAAGTGGAAFVVNGFRPADSLVAAAPAAREGAALLLASGDGLPEVSQTALRQLGIDRVVIVGGEAAVSEAVAERLRTIVGAGAVRRVAGATRAETAASVARAFPSSGHRYLANASDVSLVDAVTAGWAAAVPGGGPVLYVERDRPGAGADRFLRLGGLGGNPPEPTRLVGGLGVLSDGLVAVLEERYAEVAAGGPPQELRGVWAHLFDDSLKTRQGIHALLDVAASANLNTVVVQVARRQDAYYASRALPVTVDPDMTPALDLLAELVPAAHDRGLAVHAWVSVLPAYHPVYDGLDLGPRHVWNAHGPTSAEPWVTTSSDGRTGLYLDPGVPDVQDHVASVLAEIAGRGVDAVHVDYLRYEDRTWGYHPISLARFRFSTGTQGDPQPDDPAWGAWRRQQTEDLARRIFLEVATVDPAVAVSLAGSTMGPGPTERGGFTGTRTYRDVFQDWPGWLEAGAVHAVFGMNYFRDDDAAQRAWYEDWVAFEDTLPDGAVAVGQASYLNSVEGSLRQIERARQGTAGVVLYSYQQTTADGPPRALLGALRSGAFADPAPAPELRAATADGHLQVRAADGVAVTARSNGSDADSHRVVADANGRASFPMLAPGTWTVQAPGYVTATVEVTTGVVAGVVLTED